MIHLPKPGAGRQANRFSLRPYLSALLLVMLFAAIQHALEPVLQSNAPLGLLLVPVMICAIYGGGMPALFASALAIVIGPFVFIDPRWSFAIARSEDRALVLIFCLVCLAISAMGALLERSRARARALMLSLGDSEQTMRAMLDSATLAVIGIGHDGKVRIANEAAFRMFGYGHRELIGQPVRLLVQATRRSADGADPAADAGPAAFEGRTELHGRKKDGSVFPIEASLSRTGMPSGLMAVSFIADITERRAMERQILHAAQHDLLTGLPNRALVYELGTQLLRATARDGGKAAVLFFDLDRFKPINDTYGHKTGDKMLQEVAHRLQGAVRSGDLVGRLGGDEFVAIVRSLKTPHDAAHAATHLLERLCRPYRIESLELRTSPSIGISMFPDDAKDIDVLIRYADAAMYEAKNSGRNAYRFFTAEVDANAKNAFVLEQKLRHSADGRDFLLLYQPIVDTRNMHVVGAEALIRWPQQHGQPLMPGQFIPAAETSGLINQIGEWVLQEACRQHHVWRKAGLPPMRIAINVSPIQFRSRDFQKRVKDAVMGAGIDPGCVELEVTESTVMKQGEEAAETLASLKQLGLRIALDDFGTGYSSLSYLSQFPIDKLKVDQSFIRQIDTDPRSLAITETVIALGRKLGVEVVAEGIESETALVMLRQRGCDLGQGYLISEPLGADRFIEWYRRTDPRQLFH